MNGFDLSTISGIFVGGTEYSAIYKGSSLIWQSGPESYDRQYLTIESLADNNDIGIKASSASYTVTIQYSTDKVTWTSVTSHTGNQRIIILNRGDKVYLRGNVDRTSNSAYNYNYFTSTGTFNVYGNVTSLLNSSSFEDIISYNDKTYTFFRLFNNSKVIDASNLILPATTLANNCYSCMFNGCTSLTTAPALPATTLAQNCYTSMFYNCTSLTTAPALSATTLANYCYSSMFYGCTSLTTAPALLATTLADNCYNAMFRNCTSLTTAPALPATTLAQNCYTSMFQGCTSLTTAPALLATTLASQCYYAMFYGCTSLTTAPALPATTLASQCYYAMLSDTNCIPDCTNIDFTSQTVVASGGLRGLFYGTKVTDNQLNSILPKNSNNKICLPVTSLANACYQNMFSNCTSLTTAPALPATTLTDYCYNAMFRGCTSLTTAPALPATTLAQYCYYEMFYNCTSLTTAPALPATTLASNCYNSMFGHCTSLTTAPALPATTLVNWCYGNMFFNCTSLTTAPTLPATTLAQYCYYAMFYNCTSLTTAPALPAITLTNYCYYYMFRNCSKLNYIKMLATNISATSCLDNWVYGVSGSGTFVKNINATWTTKGVSGVPSGWTVQTADPSISDNANIKIYDNYEIGSSTQYNKIHNFSIGNNKMAIGTNTSAWYYQKGKSITFGTNGSYMAMSSTFKMNIVFTGLSQFKLLLNNSSNIYYTVLNKINDDTKISYSDYSSSNTHVQVYTTSYTEYIYTNLDPNVKYTIAINLRSTGSCTTNIIIPSAYPTPTRENSYFTSSADYTEIYGS